MLKYAKVINNETRECEVGIGNNNSFYESIGMELLDVEQAYNNRWYIACYLPEKPKEIKEEEVRAVRNSYLEKYVDPYQLVIRWKSLTEEEQEIFKEYRQYLLDYTDTENWWEKNPLTFDEWIKGDESSVN